MAHELQDRLMSMGPEQAQAFHDILHIYEELADQYGLWDAASIMMEWCSDDGFIDFRAWLIAQGREVYLAALKDPDSLADVEPYGNCCFESLTYVGDAAYRQLTGEDINENADPSCQREAESHSGGRHHLSGRYPISQTETGSACRLSPAVRQIWRGQNDLTPTISAGTSDWSMCGRCWSRGNSMT